MLEQILRAIKNYFIVKVYDGTFSIENGTIIAEFLKEGQYFKIDGSILNDGVYQYPASELKDEEFTGEIWAMAVPNAVIALADEIEAWCEKNKDVLDSPYVSESFGGYSYSKGTGGGSSGISAPITWKEAFASRLNQWRKVRYESPIRGNDKLRFIE